MGCSYCENLCTVFRIAHPSQIQKAINVVKDNLADSTLKEIVPSTSLYSQQSFSDLASGKTWDDVFQYYFQCQHCSEQFKLHAETYHGSGGAWEVINESERVAL